MTRFTLANFRARWPAEALGICSADPQVTAYANDSQERLLLDPLTPSDGWWGTWMRMNLSAFVTNGAAYITTPREVADITDIAACGHPIRLRNGFYEFLQFSRGIEPKHCRAAGCGGTFQSFVRDNVATLAPFDNGSGASQIIRIYPTDPRDVGLRVLVQGLDSNRMVVTSTDPGTGLSAPGEYMVLKFPFVDSVNRYTSITGIQKDQTYGMIQFFQVNTSSGNETILSSMEPNEQTGWYRRFMVNGIPNMNLCCTSPGNPITITANVRLDFVPVQSETDYLTLPNVAALLEESMSIKFSRMDSGNAQQNSQIHHARAIALLNGDMDLHTGKWNVAVNVPIWGSSGRMRRQPV